MTAKTSTERGQALRKKREKAGLSEVRGLWAKTADHDTIKAAATAIAGDPPGQMRRKKLKQLGAEWLASQIDMASDPDDSR